MLQGTDGEGCVWFGEDRQGGRHLRQVGHSTMIIRGEGRALAVASWGTAEGTSSVFFLLF